MRPTTILAFSAGLLMACGRGGSSEQRATTAAAGDPAPAEARSSAPGQPTAEPVPFAPRSEQRRAQDSVLRSPALHKRLKAPADSA